MKGLSVTLQFSPEPLRELGLPDNFPWMLEFGSEEGIPPVAHIRTAWDEFMRRYIAKVTQELVNAVV